MMLLHLIIINKLMGVDEHIFFLRLLKQTWVNRYDFLILISHGVGPSLETRFWNIRNAHNLYSQ